MQHTMPLSIGKMTVNVSLCGAIPRSDLPPSPAPTQSDTASAHALRENITTSHLNKQGALKPASTHSLSLKPSDRSKTPALILNGDNLPSLLSKTVSQSEDSEDTAPIMPRLSASRPQIIPFIEPPRWAVPAKGEARLEVSDVPRHCQRIFSIL